MIKGHENRLAELAAVPFIKALFYVLLVAGFAFCFVMIGRAIRNFRQFRAADKEGAEREILDREIKVQADNLLDVLVGSSAAEQWKDFPPHIVAHGMISTACVKLRLAHYSDAEISRLLAAAFTSSGRVVEDFRREASNKRRPVLRLVGK